jgi:hypothetical protein
MASRVLHAIIAKHASHDSVAVASMGTSAEAMLVADTIDSVAREDRALAFI